MKYIIVVLVLFTSSAPFVFSQKKQKQEKQFERVTSYPDGKQTSFGAAIVDLYTNPNMVRVIRHSFNAPYEKVWDAADQATKKFTKIGKRPIKIDEEKGRISNSNIEDSRNKETVLIGTTWVDELLTEVTYIEENLTKVTVTRKVLEYGADSQGKNRWTYASSNGKIERWLLTLIEKEINESSLNINEAQSASSQKFTDVVTKQFPDPISIVLLPTNNGYLDESEESKAMTEEAAEQLRGVGYTVQTIRQANVAREVNKTIGRSSAIGRTSIGRLGTALGVGAIILVALATAKENEMSVTTSIYASNRGVFEEISRSTSNLKTNNKNISSQRTVTQCTENLLVNGDFEQDWVQGWKRKYSDIERGSSITEIVRQSNSNVLHMKHVGLSDVSLHQIVEVPKGRIFFGFETKFVTREGPVGGFSGTGTAGLNVIFLDANEKPLGLLWAGSYQKNLFEDTGLVGVPRSPVSSNSAAFITIPNNTLVNQRLEISKIARDRLGKLDLNKVRYIAINVAVGATDRSASAEAWVDNLSLEVCP